MKGQRDKDPNTEVIKFLAACLVILSHAYPLNLGDTVSDGLSVLTRGQMNWGAVSVSVFFTLSGYYLARSVGKCRRGWDYGKARSKRLLPSLWIVVALSVFCIGPLFTTLPLGAYFQSGGTWRYFGNALLLPIHDLPGVFTNNPYSPTVNGPLWTLPVEALCYVALWLLHRLGLVSKKRFFLSVPLFACGAGVLVLMSARFPILLSMLRPAFCFYMGVFLRLYSDDNIYGRTRTWARWAGYVALTVGSVALGIANIAMGLLVPLLTVELTRSGRHSFGVLERLGGYSYEIYLLGWPVQQMLIAWLGPMPPCGNAALAILFCVGLALPLKGAADRLARGW